MHSQQWWWIPRIRVSWPAEPELYQVRSNKVEKSSIQCNVWTHASNGSKCTKDYYANKQSNTSVAAWLNNE